MSLFCYMIVSIARTSDIENFGGILTILEVHGDFEKKLKKSNLWSFSAVFYVVTLSIAQVSETGIFMMTIMSVVAGQKS